MYVCILDSVCVCGQSVYHYYGVFAYNRIDSYGAWETVVMALAVQTCYSDSYLKKKETRDQLYVIQVKH